MNPVLKSIVLFMLRILSVPFALIPARLRLGFIKTLSVIDSRIGQPGEALKRQFALADMIDQTIAERATAYGDGEHPKHRLMRYHDFFVERIPEGSRVMDVGCGYGAVARTIALKVPGVVVTGVELNAERYAQAINMDNPPNLSFVHDDALATLPDGDWDTIVLSNVVEHIDDRVGFLKSLIANLRPARLLIRVPLFERHWHVPLRQELGVNYFSDRTHFIEHTLAQFEDEMSRAGIDVTERLLRWGEIWAACKPVESQNPTGGVD